MPMNNWPSVLESVAMIAYVAVVCYLVLEDDWVVRVRDQVTRYLDRIRQRARQFFDWHTGRVRRRWVFLKQQVQGYDMALDGGE